MLSASAPAVSAIQQEEITMATLTIRNLGARVKERLRVARRGHGRSMEAEARRILSADMSGDGCPSFGRQ
jgi:plasmid stability protein